MISTVTNFLNICKDSVVTRRHNGIIPVLMVQSLMDTLFVLLVFVLLVQEAAAEVV